MESPVFDPHQPAQPQPANAAGEKQELKQLLFSFTGRLSRKPFWLYSLAMLFVCACAFVLAGAMGKAGLIILVPLYFFYVWASLAMQIKRWHDRNKSGWWVLIGLIPVIGSIWVFIEVGCLRGTLGANNFGGDPTDLY